jgi:hypothetical protein
MSVLKLFGFWKTSLSAAIDYNTGKMEVDFLKTFSKNEQNLRLTKKHSKHYADKAGMR